MILLTFFNGDGQDCAGCFSLLIRHSQPELVIPRSQASRYGNCFIGIFYLQAWRATSRYIWGEWWWHINTLFTKILHYSCNTKGEWKFRNVLKCVLKYETVCKVNIQKQDEAITDPELFNMPHLSCYLWSWDFLFQCTGSINMIYYFQDFTCFQMPCDILHALNIF